MEVRDAGMVFPVLGITGKFDTFGIDSLEGLGWPRESFVERLEGAELVDADGKHFRVTEVRRLGPQKRWLLGRFVQVAVELEPLGQTDLEALKARIVADIKKPRRYGGEVWDRLEDLAIVRTADRLEQLVSWGGGNYFLGARWRGRYRAWMGRAPDAPFDDAATGPALGLDEAGMVWPVIGVPSPPRNLGTLKVWHGPRDLSVTSADNLKPGAYPRMELIDSAWRRFRIAEVRRRGRDGWPLLWVLIAPVKEVKVKVALRLEPLPPTSLEAVRARILAMFDEDPAGWTGEYSRKDQGIERSRIKAAGSLDVLAAKFDGYRPYAVEHKPLIYLLIVYAGLAAIGLMAILLPTGDPRGRIALAVSFAALGICVTRAWGRPRWWRNGNLVLPILLSLCAVAMFVLICLAQRAS